MIDQSTLDPEILAFLVCPVTGGTLRISKNGQELISRAAGLAYPIRQGVPILRYDQARQLSESE